MADTGQMMLYMLRRCEFPTGLFSARMSIAGAGCEPFVVEYSRDVAPLCHDITCAVCYTDKQRENSSRRREILDTMAREAQEAGFYDL